MCDESAQKDKRMAKSNNANGFVRVVGAIILTAVAIWGMYAGIPKFVDLLVRPMEQRMDFICDKLDKLDAELNAIASRAEGQLDKHATLLGHPGMVADLAATREKFVEVETQFLGVREAFTLRFEALEREHWGPQRIEN